MSERRELILQLGQMITDRIGHKVTTEDPEYWGLACIVTDEMAEVALKMKVRKPMTFEQMLKATGKEEKKLQELLDEMSRVGLIEYNWENPKREKQYVLPMFVPGSAEFTNMNKQLPKSDLKLQVLRADVQALEKVTLAVPPGRRRHQHTRQEALIERRGINPLISSTSPITVSTTATCCKPAPLNKVPPDLYEGCADDPEDWCIAVGDMADYVVETNKGGRYITYDEVMEIPRRG